MMKEIIIFAGLYPTARKINRLIHPSHKLWFESNRNVLRQFIGDGDLAFDVGANRGSRTEMMLSLGAKVIAFEPQPQCAVELRAFNHPNLTIVECAVGETEKKATIHLKLYSTHASLLDEWSTDVPEIGNLKVSVTTLDAAIARYGLPRFCKIDVEGYEPQVFQGLSQPIDSMCFEYHHDGKERALACLEKLRQLGDYEANLTTETSAGLVSDGWVPVCKFIASFHDISSRGVWGDIFVKLRR